MDIRISKTTVKGPREALELALKLKNQGKYDVFRGQKKCWPLISSSMRLDKAEEKITNEKLGNLAHWIEHNEEIKNFLTNKDDIFSVAQHYGIPTTYIDFTFDPKIALFFALDNNNDSLDDKGCIYCASRNQIKKDINVFRKNIPDVDIRIVHNKVKNLWRMQNQKGLFLNFPVTGVEYWEDFFSFHKIVFPHKKYYKSKIPKKVIYPTRKSKLEIKLDQYFRADEVHRKNKIFEKTVGELHYVPWNSNEFIFKDNAQIKSDRIWSKKLNLRLNENEDYNNLSGKFIIKINIVSLKEIKETFYEYLYLALEKNNNLLSYIVTFEIFSKKTNFLWTKEMTYMLELYWDGVRQCQYSPEEICEGFSNLGLLLYNSTLNKKDYITYTFGEVFSFDFLVKNGLSVDITLPKKEFIEYSNNSLLEKVDFNLYPKIKNMIDLTYHIHDISILFKFLNFKEFFIKYAIPSQIVSNYNSKSYYYENEVKKVIIYNPNELISLRPPFASLYLINRIRNIKRVITLKTNFSDNKLIEIMAESAEKIMKDQVFYTINFSEFNKDEREIYKIPKAVAFFNRLLSLGFVSILQLTTYIKSEAHLYDPYVLGGFEVWMIAKGKFKKRMLKFKVRSNFKTFYKELEEYNRICSKLIKASK